MQCRSPTDLLLLFIATLLAVLLMQSIYTCVVCMSSRISNCSVAFTRHTTDKRLSAHDHASLCSYFLATCAYDMCTTIQETHYRLLETWIILWHYSFRFTNVHTIYSNHPFPAQHTCTFSYHHSSVYRILLHNLRSHALSIIAVLHRCTRSAHLIAASDICSLPVYQRRMTGHSATTGFSLHLTALSVSVHTILDHPVDFHNQPINQSSTHKLLRESLTYAF